MIQLVPDGTAKQLLMSHIIDYLLTSKVHSSRENLKAR